MSLMYIDGDTLSDIANAIRAKTGTSVSLTPLEMPTAIANIPSGAGAAGEIVLREFRNWTGVTTPKTYSYTATKTGKLFLFVSYQQGGKSYNPITLTKNGTAVTATYEGGGKMTSSTGYAWYRIFEVDVESNDALVITTKDNNDNAYSSDSVFGVLVATIS